MSSRSGTKYTPELHRKIVDALRLGAFKKHAANSVGVSEQTLGTWLQWGAEGRVPYDRFLHDVEQAIAADAIRNQTIISKAAAGEHSGDWKAAAWNLERKFPRLYGHMAAGHDQVGGEKPFSPWKQPAGAVVRDN